MPTNQTIAYFLAILFEKNFYNIHAEGFTRYIIMSLEALRSLNNTNFENYKLSACSKEASNSLSIYSENNRTLTTTNTELNLEMAPKENIELIAHRGYSEFAPENTIPAFVAAANNGFDTVECDIQWTKDSIPVLLHDSTINRTARHQNGWKIIFEKGCSDLNYEELLKFDFGIWKSKEFKGTKIPTFSEFADCCAENNLKPYVEIKQNSGFNEEKAKKLIEIIKESGLEDKVTWISFNANYLKIISEIMPECRLGYLSDTKPSEKIITTLESLKTEYNEVFLDVKSNAIDRESSEMLKNEGFFFEAWTVDDEEQVYILQEYDCMGITTNSLTENAIKEYLDD